MGRADPEVHVGHAEDGGSPWSKVSPTPLSNHLHKICKPCLRLREPGVWRENPQHLDA